MIEALDLVRIFTENPALLALLGSVFGADVAILSLAFLSGTGVMPFWIILIFSILGFTLVDTFWYFTGKYKILSYNPILNFSIKSEKYIQKISKGKNIFLLAYSKFVYGTRILTIIYISNKVPSGKFLLYNSIFDTILVSFLVIAGFYSGKGIGNFVNVFESFQSITLVVFSLILLIIVINTVMKFILERITRN